MARFLVRAGSICAAVTMSVLAVLGVAKLLDLPQFMLEVRQWSVVPEWLRAPAVVLVPTLEVGLATHWFVGKRRAIAEALGLAMIFGFTTVYLIQWSEAEAPSCGCFGILARHYREMETAKVLIAKNTVMGLFLSIALVGHYLQARRSGDGAPLGGGYVRSP